MIGIFIQILRFAQNDRLNFHPEGSKLSPRMSSIIILNSPCHPERSEGSLKQRRIIKVYIPLLQTEMPVRKFSRFPTPWSPHDESFLDEERLVNLFKSTLVLTYRRSDRIGSDRSSLELRYDGLKYLVINGIQSPLVYIESIKGISCDCDVHPSVAHDLSEVTHSSQEGIRDSWSTTASESDLIGRILVDLHL